MHGIDPDMFAHHATWPRWALGQATAVCVGLAAAHPHVSPHLALASDVPFYLIAGWPLGYAIFVVLQARLFTDPRFAALRTALIVYTVAILASFGACSRLDVSPGYGILLLFPPCLGHIFVNNRTMLASFAIAPLALRALTVPDASWESFGLAAAMGAASAFAFAVFSIRRVEDRRREARRRRAATYGAASLEYAADRRLAGRLHDQLSGVLMLARARDGSLDDELTRLVISQARCALACAPRAIDPERCAAELRTIARSLGVDADIRTSARDPSTAWSELFELLVELVANHARHGSDRALSIELAFRGGAVRAIVGSRSASPTSAASGRGRRNLTTRATAWGGVVRWRERRGGWSVEIALPTTDASPPWFAYLWIAEIAMHALSALLLAQAGLIAAIAFGVLSFLLAIVNAVDLRIDRLLQDRRHAALRARIAALEPDAIERTRATLDPLVDELERAPPGDRGATIARLARALGDQLAHLERAELSDRAARA